MDQYKVKPFYSPVSLLIRQSASAFLFGSLVGWKKFLNWSFDSGFKSMPVSAGAIGMGCIGFPAHPAWEVTSACNLNCIHCHATGGRPSSNEMDTNQGKRFIEQLALAQEFRMLVFTGGEPTVRNDIFELFAHSKSVGFKNVIATNAMIIDDKMALEMKRTGVVGAAISLDSANKETHNFVRNNRNAFDCAMRGIRAIKKAGILLQINVTAMSYNFDELSQLVDLADDIGASIMLMYQLVPVGRGEAIGDAKLDLKENERLTHFLKEKQRTSRTIIEPVAGPQYWPHLLESRGITDGWRLSLAEKLFHGCSAGRGFVYIKPNGDVWPCPFVPINCGNVRDERFLDIWRNSSVFNDLRNRETRMSGKCGDCRYSTLCGGCRGRAMALSNGDYLSEDPTCFIPHRNRKR
ncbi:MAG: radical SAM protein [Desulfomonilaceae bacterium]